MLEPAFDLYIDNYRRRIGCIYAASISYKGEMLIASDDNGQNVGLFCGARALPYLTVPETEPANA